MNGSILDTNIIIHIMKGAAVVADAVRKIRGIYVPVIVLGELLFGAEKSHLKQSTRDKYLQFCLSYPLLDVTKDVAQNYGGLKYALQAKGTIIPENDMWIGAIAITHGMTVLTND